MILDPKGKTPTDDVSRVQSVLKEKAAEEKRMQSRQGNVSSGGVIGVDWLDRLVETFFNVKAPGFDALFTDARFPKRNGYPFVASRCYFFNNMIIDILDKDEVESEKLLEDKAVLSLLGFKYTWIIKGEDVDLKTIFKDRMEMVSTTNNVIKPISVKQTNVTRTVTNA